MPSHHRESTSTTCRRPDQERSSDKHILVVHMKSRVDEALRHASNSLVLIRLVMSGEMYCQGRCIRCSALAGLWSLVFAIAICSGRDNIRSPIDD